MKQKNIIFVGAHSTDTTRGIGGVRYACQSLLASPLSDQVNWLLINSTVPMNIRKLKRAAVALSRVIRLVYLLITRPHVDTVFIFGNYELTSFLEKGTMVLLSKVFQKRVLLSLRTQIRRHSYDTWFTPFRRRVLRNCDQIICQSAIAAQNLVELIGCNPERITVIMNWLDMEKYIPPSRAYWSPSQDSDPITFIFIGHLNHNKAPDILLRAAKILAERRVAFKLVYCGDGPLHDQLRQDIIAFNLVSQAELRGWVVGEDLIHALWDADVFVLPTHSEGMPNALLEAMAAGLPVITTPVSSIPEIVTEGENGFFVQPGNALELADAMERMINTPELRKHMSENNIARIRQNHSIETAWRVVASIL